jgi:hypothetical protein
MGKRVKCLNAEKNELIKMGAKGNDESSYSF